MQVYAVRLRANKELVGIFWAERLADLFWRIDECVDPGACEYARLPAGGLFYPSHGAGRTPAPEAMQSDGDRPSWDSWFSGHGQTEITATEAIEDRVFYGENIRWQSGQRITTLRALAE